ncbi:MAG: nucleoside hydrolase [Chloroflexi bacterium]|nr:nucleoside hydrolase [Chloroflexota bacterium]
MRPRERRPGPALPLTLVVVLATALGACGTSTDRSAPPLVTGDPPTDRIPIIVDTDLDLSDVAALAVLLRDPAVDVRALTIAPTGTGVTNCASARLVGQYVLEEFGAAGIPFACGRVDPGPDGLRFPDEWRLNANAGWGLAMTPRPNVGVPEDAVTLLARAVDESPSAPTIVALGPWTNLEDVATADPTIADRIAAIHAMGGAVDVPGNVIVGDLAAADGLEWNFAADPSAVTAVFATETPISLVPLDATDDVPIPPELADRLAEDHAAAGADLLYELVQRVPARITGEGQQLWDELAALTVSAPDLVSWEDATLLAEVTGRVIRAEAGRPVRIATSADREAVEAAFLGALRVGAPRVTPFEPAGAFTARWDGSTCALEMDGDLRAGVATLTFENSTGKPAGVEIAGIREPRTWQELRDLLPTLDIETAPLPDWIIDAGGAADEPGAGGSIMGSVTLEAGTYGPVCMIGSWPDVKFHPGQPFVVAAP